MGEIADMMLDGTLCEGCGEYIGDGAPGYPRYCSAACARGRGVSRGPAPHEHKAHPCPKRGCSKRFRTAEAATQHYHDKHAPNPKE